MKKHRLFISSKKDLKALNKKIAIDSLFSVGETITNSPLVIGEKDLGIDELLEDLFNDGHYSWNKDNTEKVGFVGNEPILVRQETDNKLLVRFLGDAWCPDVVEEWVKRIEHDKNNDVDYVIDTYMFGVIENDQERKSRDFHVSFCYRG